ncbi:MAG: FGGY family carbohydrate kinase, partial [Actinomycetota bacterium]|nr:FGGY family carbohydrate kinase [Actinomycetota bacterium]
MHENKRAGTSAGRGSTVTSDLILSIDAGTTGVTALVVDASAQVVASGYREFEQHFPASDRVEHDLGEVWSATIA